MQEIRKVIEILRTEYKGESMLASLSRRTPFEILIATALSARAKDEVTINIAQEVFKRYPTAESLANADDKGLEAIIKPIGFYRIKAKRIKEIAQTIIEKYGGIVPDTMEELVSINGVGRKTAGCVLVYAFKKDAIPVDTHVHQIVNRLGWVSTRNPLDTEKRLLKIIPKNLWIDVNEVFVLHGKAICVPVSPFCSRCMISRFCKKKKVKRSR